LADHAEGARPAAAEAVRRPRLVDESRREDEQVVGNVIDPSLSGKIRRRHIRYFVMREMSLGQDADFTDEKLIQRYQSDLGMTWGTWCSGRSR